MRPRSHDCTSGRAGTRPANERATVPGRSNDHVIPGLSDQQALFFLVLIVAFALLITERLRNDAVAVLIVLALYAIGAADEKMALSGFSSEPAVVVAAIFVLSAAMHQTGLSETIGSWIGRLAGQSFTRSIAVIMP